MRNIAIRARTSLIIAAGALGIALGMGGLSTPAAADSYRVVVGYYGHPVFHHRYVAPRFRGYHHRRHFRRYHRGWGGHHRGWGHRGWSHREQRIRHRSRRHGSHHGIGRFGGRSDRVISKRHNAPRNGRGGNRGRR